MRQYLEILARISNELRGLAARTRPPSTALLSSEPAHVMPGSTQWEVNCSEQHEGDFMRFLVAGFTIVTVAGLSSCIGTGPANRAAVPPTGLVRTVSAEPGVVPPGTWLVVRTNDPVNARTAYRSTVYSASISEDVLDQKERVLIPKASPVELGVRSLSYLGPGGAGMTKLTLDAPVGNG